MSKQSYQTASTSNRGQLSKSSGDDLQACSKPSEETKSCCSSSSFPLKNDDKIRAEETSQRLRTAAEDQSCYKLWPFVCDWIPTEIGPIPQVTCNLSRADIMGHWQMRWGLGRTRYSVTPGLYAVGQPNAQSMVLVTANYKMSFDLLRQELSGRHLWILVLDTKGINVWCAAGKGTFGTCELISRIKTVQLDRLVTHRKLIVPQLGAVGVSAHAVKKGSGFEVIYGPIRASDLPTFLDNNLQANEEMRRATFDTFERLALTPVELINARKQIFWGLAILFLLSGIGPEVFSFDAVWSRGLPASLACLTGLGIGAVLVPVALPWLPSRAFAFKGAVAGMIGAVLILAFWGHLLNWFTGLSLIIGLPAISSWYAMLFTGSTTFTSPSGVEKEMRMAIPVQAIALFFAGLCWVFGAF